MEDGSQVPISFIITVIALLLAAAYFAICETAISSCSKAKVRAAAERGDRKAKRVLEVLEHFEKAISTISICTNIVHISIASVITVFVTGRFGLSWVTLSTVITTLVVFFAGEMLPKSIAKKTADRIVPSICGSLRFFMQVFSPFSALLSAIGGSVTKLGKGSGEPEVSVTEEELYDIIEDMTEEGTLDEEQGDLISSALQFGDITAESIVTPRVDLVAIDREDTPEEILGQFKSCSHSRLPVYEGSIDNIIGVLQVRKFIKAYLRDKEKLELLPLLEEVLFIHSSAKIDEVLPELSRRRMNMAVVTDNYGGTLGIVTIEDILEELVGDIWDEDDVVEESVVQLSENVFRVDADETVSDMFESLDVEDPEDDEELVNTLMSEWAFERLSAMPKPGDSFTYHGLKVTVEKMEHHRILSLMVEIPKPEAEGGAEA